MKFYPNNGPLFADLPITLRETFGKITACQIDHWNSKMDQCCLAVAEDLEPAQVVTEILDKKINHLLQKNCERFKDDILSAGKLAENPQGYFQSEYKAFSEAALDDIALRFVEPEQKQEMKKKSLGFIDKIQSPAVLQAADSIIEELYMNAMFDAPREAGKTNDSLKTEEAEIFLAYSKHSLQISCTDLYGSLDVRKFLVRMREVYAKGVGQAINFSAVGRGFGAGIGCVILFENCTSLTLGVRRGQVTKVTCVLPLGIRNRQREQMRKNLHWFEI